MRDELQAMQPKVQSYQGFDKNETSDFEMTANQPNWPGHHFQMLPPPGYLADAYSENFGEDFYNVDQQDSSSGGFHSAHSHSSRSTESISLEEYNPHQRKSEPIPISNFDRSYYNPAPFPMHSFAGTSSQQQNMMVGHTGSSSRSMYSGNFAQAAPVYGLNTTYQKPVQNPKTRSGLKMHNMPHIQSVEMLHDDEAPEFEQRIRTSSHYTLSTPRDEELKDFRLVNDQNAGDRDTTFGTGASSKLTTDCFSERDLSEIFSVNPQETATLFLPIMRPKTNQEMQSVLSAYKQEIYEGFKVIPEIKPVGNSAGNQARDSAAHKKDAALPTKKDPPPSQGFSIFSWNKKKGT